MFKTIIVPLDGSEFAERALAPARVLAHQSGADVVLITHSSGGVVVDPRAYLLDAGRRHDVPEPELRIGTRGSLIPLLARLVGEVLDPIVCMSTHGRSGPGRALFGSTAEDVVRRIGVPMLLVGPHVPRESPATFEDVVVCTDGSGLSRAIVPVVDPWIRDLPLRGTVVEVVDPAVARRAGDDHLTEAAVPREVAHTLTEETGGEVQCEVLYSGHPRDAIVDFAAHRGTSLIALATHGRTGLARLAFGSVAAQIVHRASCPVLVVRPPDLASEPST